MGNLLACQVVGYLELHKSKDFFNGPRLVFYDVLYIFFCQLKAHLLKDPKTSRLSLLLEVEGVPIKLFLLETSGTWVVMDVYQFGKERPNNLCH